MSAAETTPPGARPLTGVRRTTVAVALALGTFMMVLDSTIANVSLPTIAGNLGVSSRNSTWVITAFAAANGVSMPLTGWLMRRFGVIRTFCMSLALFTLMSFLCGMAWSLPSLVFFRVLQGAVAGPMMPGSQSLLIAIYPPGKRATALGIWSITTLVGPIVGPILGGYISDNYHWSWIFLINVPIGIFTSLYCWSMLRDREVPPQKLPIDTIGLILLVVWVASLQILLDLGEDADWFNSPMIVTLTIIAAIGFLAWLIWEWTDANPMVDLRLFSERNYAIGTLTFCLGYAVFFASILIVPLWMQTQLGYTATWAGLVLAPSGLVALLLTPFVVWLSHKIDMRILATIAFGAFITTFWLRTKFTTSLDFWQYTIPISVQGVAMATFFLVVIAISLDRVPVPQIPSATGIANFARMVCGAIAASVMTTLWDRREVMHQTHLANAVGERAPVRQAIDTLQQLGLDQAQAAGVIARQMVHEAYMLSFIDIFWLSTWLAVSITAVIWFTHRVRPTTG